MNQDQPHGLAISIGNDTETHFRLLWDQAPETCSGVISAMPYEGEVLHATCSGAMAVFFLAEEIAVSPENATTCVRVGDLLFTHYPAGWRLDHPDFVSEIYWAYAPDARPTVPGLFVPALASVFARHDGSLSELEAFCEQSRRLHRDGVAAVRATTYDA